MQTLEVSLVQESLKGHTFMGKITEAEGGTLGVWGCFGADFRGHFPMERRYGDSFGLNLASDSQEILWCRSQQDINISFDY